MKHYYAYIDEAGDEGFGKLKLDDGFGQSRWFMIGAILVGAANNSKLPAWKKEIRDRFPEKRKLDIHFSNLNHDQRRAACASIAAKPLAAAVMLSHKVTIPGSKYEGLFKKPQHLYNYLVRYLLERLIPACEAKAAETGDEATLHVIFSRRGGTNYEVMRKYLRKLADGRDIVKGPRDTNWKVLDIDGMEVENHSKRAGLQLADCVTSAFFEAIEPNRFGDTEQSYAQRLAGRLLTERGSSRNCGLTLVGMHRAAARELRFMRSCWDLKEE